MQGAKYLVEGEHLACHLAAIVQCYSHFIIDLDVYEFESAAMSLKALELTRFCYALN